MTAQTAVVEWAMGGGGFLNDVLVYFYINHCGGQDHPVVLMYGNGDKVCVRRIPLIPPNVTLPGTSKNFRPLIIQLFSILE